MNTSSCKLDSRTVRLKQIVEPTIEDLGYELWGIEQSGTGAHSRVCIYIDSNQGISADDCAQVSDRLCTLLDVEDVIVGSYDLEISSPGVDRRLFTPNQYQRYLGDQIDVRLHHALDGSRHLKGTLRKCSLDSICMDVEGQDKTIPFTQIRRTRLVPVLD